MIQWEALAGVAGHMDIKYEGGDADRNLIDSLQYSKSLEGSSRLYRLIAHYCLYGEVLTPRQKSSLRCFSAPAEKGSYDTAIAVLTDLTHHYPAFNDIYKKAFDWLVATVMTYVKDSLSGKSSVKELVEVIKEQAKDSSELNVLLANGLVRANDNLASLLEKAISSAPLLVEQARPHYRAALTPVGKSCVEMIQFSGKEGQIVITEPDALAIRSDEDLVVGEAGAFTINRVFSLSVNSGSCLVEIDGMGGTHPGKITDIALSQPNNPYTRALDNHKPFKVRAKPVYKDGDLHKLFITEA